MNGKIDISFWTTKKSEYNLGIMDTIKPEHDSKYCFDYMEDAVKQWNCEHIDKQMLHMIPWDIFIFSDLTDSGYQKDHYGKDIIDIQDWLKQREEYIDYLYEKYR